MSDDTPVHASKVPTPCAGDSLHPACPLPPAALVLEALGWNAGAAARWVTCVQAITLDATGPDGDSWTGTDGLFFEDDLSDGAPGPTSGF